MTVAIDDLQPLIWHAELGDKLLDVWTGTNHRGVQLNDLRAAVNHMDGQIPPQCWLRQLSPYANCGQEDRALRVIARMDGTPFPSAVRLTGEEMGLLTIGKREHHFDPGSFWSRDVLPLAPGYQLTQEIPIVG
jgi:hypothetical protein